MEKGNLSINSENILPIIKKWLYSDVDIFLRELVSNGCDAISKLKKLVQMGEADGVSKDEKYLVKVILDVYNKTVTISDNGLGMTSEEINKYINQIAISGAEDFVEKYKDRLGESSDQIIGHFGLGFYSAFMVSDTVEIDSLSYKSGSESARWKSDGGIEYEISQSDKSSRGTDVILHISKDNEEFLSEYKLREILNKYCSFMPVEIYLETVKKQGEAEEKDSVNDEELTEKTPVNDTKPLWLKPAKEVTDEEYKAFYHKVFMDFNDPLFWIHLNMDYPFRLAGILYFPKLRSQYDTIEGQVKLYCNQVFVADNVKEVVPEFLLLLKGVMDCPDIPLNVSRSFLQNDANVSKMSGYITRKVADKLNFLYKNDKDEYGKYWDDINVFIKFGCIKDKSFYEKVKDSIIYKTLDGSYKSAAEFTDDNKDKTGNNIYYVTDKTLQSQYIRLFRDSDLDAVVLDHPIDSPFISYVESYTPEIKFARIDSDISKA
ncbi:MAG: molecular chaperone HtpG, partial [Clostridiales bacterium]|nr:molecular chaperone HtpG [Clostridiales bacterium]